MRIVLDTNTLVSALLVSHGPSAALVDAWLDDAFELITSAAQLDELARVLNYERIRKRLEGGTAAVLVDQLRQVATVVEPVPNISASIDPDDNAIISTAIAGRADLIVSGDKRHMLNLKQAEGIPIVTAQQAIARLNTGD